MPFAGTFRAMLALPFPGETLGTFTVECVDCHDAPGVHGLHRYSARMVVRGPGGQQGLRRALQPLLGAQPTTFSAYGNPYQLWCDRPTIEPLGDRRYAVTFTGSGMRISLGRELERFLAHLEGAGRLTAACDDPALVAEYLERYQADVERNVSRYRARLRRATGEDLGE